MVATGAHLLRSAGQLVALESEVPRVRRDLVAAAGGSIESDPAIDAAIDAEHPGVHLWVERGGPFTGEQLRLVTRGVWVDRDGNALLEDAGGSGYRQWWSVQEQLRVRSRWTPRTSERAAAVLLPSRHRALQAQVLLHYPVMWWALLHGLAPVHASVVEVDGTPVLLAGPGGVGKSTLVATELARGARATCDNLAVTDGTRTYGLAEPLRLDPGLDSGLDSGLTSGLTRGLPGPRATRGRTTHGRREHGWSQRSLAMTPQLVVVVRRGDGPHPRIRPIPGEQAARALVAGTLAAGELQRFWVLVGQLALATGHGPAVPPVEEMSHLLTDRLPCVELALGDRPGVGLGEMLAGPLAETRNEEVER